MKFFQEKKKDSLTHLIIKGYTRLSNYQFQAFTIFGTLLLDKLLGFPKNQAMTKENILKIVHINLYISIFISQDVVVN